jgi:hypothetical protein
MKSNIFGAVVVLLSMTGVICAQGGELSGTLDVTYASAYIWRGIDMDRGGHGEGVIQPSLTLDLYGTGLGLNVFWSRANTDRFENNEELDTTVFYSTSLFEYETYATNCTVGWVYYDYPDMPSNRSDQQEAFASFSWPEICPEGLVPSYTVIHMWPSESKTIIQDVSGWAHVFGLGYDLPVEGILPDVPEQILHLSMAVVYNEGMAAANVDHDWSHAVFGVTTDFDLGNDMTLTPGVYYQSSWEDSVNTSDEFWGTVSVKYSF